MRIAWACVRVKREREREREKDSDSERERESREDKALPFVNAHKRTCGCGMRPMAAPWPERNVSW